MSKTIMGIKVDHRHEDVSKVQGLLTDYGMIIKTRLGLHSSLEKGDEGAEEGIIILEFISDSDEKVYEFESSLEGLQGVHVDKMIF